MRSCVRLEWMFCDLRDGEKHITKYNIVIGRMCLRVAPVATMRKNDSWSVVTIHSFLFDRSIRNKNQLLIILYGRVVEDKYTAYKSESRHTILRQWYLWLRRAIEQYVQMNK